MVIQQSSPKAIIEWQSFNVGGNASVQFQQPNRDSVSFNRVLDVNPSQILGRIQANGQVFLSNPNGVVFSATAQVDVGGLVVTVHDIRDRDFQEGRFNFSSDSKGAVVNKGSLQAQLGGYVALLAPEVRNEGVVLAREGTAALASGRSIGLTLQGSQLVSVVIAEPVMNALIENKHLIRAEGGLVVLSARSANAILESVIAQSGDIQAPSLLNRNGRVILDSGEKGAVSVSSNIDASGSAAGTTGGRIIVTGEHVSVTGKAQIMAHGPSGGGEIYIGGGWQGKDKSIREASSTSIGAGATADASATDAGDGGTVVVWSNLLQKDGLTKVEGSLKATGGNQGGDGGRIETSGAKISLDNIKVDASSPRGRAGQWLIDPYNVTITNNNSNTNNSQGVWTAFGNDSRILSTDIEAALNAGTNVFITTTGAGTQDGDIFVSAPITSSQSLASLNLVADRNISIESAILLSGSGSLVKLQAGGAVTGTSAIRLNAQVTADTVHLVATEGGSITQSAALTTNNLAIDTPKSDVALTHASNDIGVLAANVKSLTAVSNTILDLQHGYGPGLSVGQVAGLSGLISTGAIDIASRRSHIYILQNIDAGGNLTLNAGSDRSPGSFSRALENNIIVKGTEPVSCLGLQCPGIPTVTTKGLGKLYTGSLDRGSENIALIAEIGSGRFRYFSDESTTNFTKALGGTGLHLIYREQPILTAYAGANTLEYGSNPEFEPRIDGLLNGDELDDAVPTLPTISIQATSLSTSFNPIVGMHSTVVNSDQVGALGYGLGRVPGTVVVTPKTLTIDGITGIDKVYDRTAAALADVRQATFQGLVSGKQTSSSPTVSDAVTISASGTFESVNVGEDINILLSHSFGGADRQNYNIVAQPNTVANITPRPLNVSATAQDRDYDGTTAAEISLETNVLAGDILTASKTNSAFVSKDVLKNSSGNAIPQTVQIGGISIAGNSAPNYQLMNTATTTTATIRPLALQVSGLTVSSRPYDGTTAIASGITGTPGVTPLGSDAVTLSYGGSYTLAFTSKDVSSASNPIIFSGASPVELTGGDSGNYTLLRLGAGSNTALLNSPAVITQRALQFSVASTADSRDYTGGREATITLGTLARGGSSGLVEGEQLNVTGAGLFDSKNVGSRTATIDYLLANAADNSGGLAVNYSLAPTTATATIVEKPVTISGVSAQDKTYDATSNATISPPSTAQLIADGIVAGDNVSVSATGTFENANAGGGKIVALTSSFLGSDAINYIFTPQASTTASILPRGGLIALAPGVYLDTSLAAADGSTRHSIVFGFNLSNNYVLPTFAPSESAVSAFASSAQPQTEIPSSRAISLSQLSPNRPPNVPSGLAASPTVLANASINTPAVVGIRPPPMMGGGSRGTALINRTSLDGSQSRVAILTSTRSSASSGSSSGGTVSTRIDGSSAVGAAARGGASAAGNASGATGDASGSAGIESNSASVTDAVGGAQDSIAPLLLLDFKVTYLAALGEPQGVSQSSVTGRTDAQLLASLPLLTSQDISQLSPRQQANIEAMIELAKSDSLAPSNLNSGDISQLDTETLSKLSPATLVLFSEQQIQALSPAQISSLPAETRSVAAAWLRPAQLANATSASLDGAFDATRGLASEKADQNTGTSGIDIRERGGDTVKMPPVSRETLRLVYRMIYASEALSAVVNQFPYTGQIGPRQAATLPDQVIQSIQPREWLRWSVDAFRAIQPQQISIIAPQVFEQLPTRHIQSMTPAQVSTLGELQILAILPRLTPSQRDSLTARQMEEVRKSLRVSMN
jgi:filamentous hemagglutinin family protein